MSNTQTEEVISQLTIAASNVVELYNRLNESDSTAESPTGESQVRRLEMSILRTHKILQDCIFRKLKQNDVDVNQTDTVKKLNDLVAKGSNNSQSSKVTMMEQYADILLDMVQQKIHNSNMWSRPGPPSFFSVIFWLYVLLVRVKFYANLCLSSSPVSFNVICHFWQFWHLSLLTNLLLVTFP